MAGHKPNVKFEGYLDFEQFDRFSKFLTWLKKDREKKLKDLFICKDCGTEVFADVNMVMIQDKLWKSICDHTLDRICDKCMEKRLGRPITESDFKAPNFGDQKIIPCNQFWLDNKKNKK